MYNESIIRNYSISVYINELNKIHKSKGIFDVNDKKTSIIYIQLLDNKKDKNTINLNGVKIIPRIERPDGSYTGAKCSILDKNLGLIAVGINSFTEKCIGENILTLQIFSEDGQILNTPKINYIVCGNLFEEVDKNEEFNILSDIISKNIEIEKNLIILSNQLQEKIKEVDMLLEKLKS